MCISHNLLNLKHLKSLFPKFSSSKNRQTSADIETVNGGSRYHRYNVRPEKQCPQGDGWQRAASRQPGEVGGGPYQVGGGSPYLPQNPSPQRPPMMDHIDGSIRYSLPQEGGRAAMTAWARGQPPHSPNTLYTHLEHCPIF